MPLFQPYCHTILKNILRIAHLYITFFDVLLFSILDFVHIDTFIIYRLTSFIVYQRVIENQQIIQMVK